MAGVVRGALVIAIGFGILNPSGWVAFGQRSTASPKQQQAVDAKPENTVPEMRPLPDITALLRAVEANEKTSEAVEKDYLYRSTVTGAQMDGHGGVKKTETTEYDVFWLEGVEVHRLMKKDGKELSADEQKKEGDRIDKAVSKAKERRAKADAKGKETDSRGEDLVTVSRLLELGSFTNARREQVNGRDVIAVDFAGDPKAKTKNRMEDVIRNVAGTAWMDEQDKVLVKAEGRFINNFKIGGGLVVNVQKGTSFSMEQRKVNDEVWLPARFEGQGSFRFLLFAGMNGTVKVVDSDYRKFKATSKILPGMSTVNPRPDPQEK
jgi:hypothetical protein